MKILVLGGNGFIGSHVCEHLVSRGHHVRVFARQPARYDVAAEGVIGDLRDSAKAGPYTHLTLPTSGLG